MSSTLVFLTIILLVVLGIFHLLAVTDLLGAFFAWIGNPVLRKLGLQSESGNNSSFDGELAKVLTVNGSEVRVELNGSSWRALKSELDWTPVEGEFVLVDGVDGNALCIVRRKEPSPQ